MEVISNANGVNLEAFVDEHTKPGATVNTDEWSAYNGVPSMGRLHSTVCHSAYEWARDDDGDGIREVHINTMEGIWLGVRNFLRVFRGVSKHYLDQYTAMFQLGYKFKAVSTLVLRIVLGVEVSTNIAT